jgi:PAS domain-containing protein
MEISLKVISQVLERLNYGVIICDNNANFKLWNKRAEVVIGISSKIENRDDWTKYFSVCKMDGTTLPLKDYPIIKALSGVTTVDDIIMVENENLEHPVYLGIDSFPLLDDELNIIGGAVVFRDITEQVKMEKLFDEISIRFEHIRKLLERSILVEEMRSEDKQAE